MKRARLLGEVGKLIFTFLECLGTIPQLHKSPSLFPTLPPAPSSSTGDVKFTLATGKARHTGAQGTRPTHSETVESPRVCHVVGGGGADRCVVLRVPQGRRGRRSRSRSRCCSGRAGLRGLMVVMVVLWRVMVMVRMAHARAKLSVARTRRELTLEQGQGPGCPRRPAGPDPRTARAWASAAGAGRPARGVQVRSDAERANAERAAFAGRAAWPGHGHHQRRRHAQRDEEVWPGVRLRQRGRGP